MPQRPLLDIRLPRQLQVRGATTPAAPLFLCDYRRSEPSPRYRITLDSNLISLVVAGSKSLIGAQQNQCFEPGTCLLFRRGRCLSADLCPDGQGYHSVLLFFAPEFLDAFKHKYRDLLRGPCTPAGTETCLAFPGDSFIVSFAEALSRSLTAADGLTPRQQALRLEEILLHLVERAGRQVIDFLEHPAGSNTRDRLERVIQQHALANLTTGELAFLCGMSAATFKRQFAVRYGMSPGRWQKEQLLAHAADLLAREQIPPADVYWRIGYSSPSSFTKAFREHHRVTPAEYQRRRRRGEAAG
jgi:AraC-like DNA-binding protein